jgi:hypothetical protein
MTVDTDFAEFVLVVANTGQFSDAEITELVRARARPLDPEEGDRAVPDIPEVRG